MLELDFKFYALNYDFNRKKIERFNIFDNHYVYENTLKLVVNYLGGSLDYPSFRDELLKRIKHEMWSRREYEISVGDAFEDDLSKYEKLDVYFQVEQNIDVILAQVISTAKEFFYNEDSLNTYTIPLGARKGMWIDVIKDEVYFNYDAMKEGITDEDLTDNDFTTKDQYIDHFIERVVKEPAWRI